MSKTSNLSQVERDKLEINPDFDFREIAERPLEDITPNEMGMFKWSGVYHQPQTGYFMVRIVIPGGFMTTQQFTRATDLAEEFARGELSITTRQTLQFHWVKQADLYKVMEGMAEVGMTTKNGCGDVPRNVIGSTLAGVSPAAIADSQKIIRMLATDPEIQNQRNLPRKHKISVAFTNEAGALTLMNCQGWVPVERTGIVGWKFHAGGGLGARPYLAKVIFDWVPEELVLDVSRATVEAFRRHGDRNSRTQARLKVVVDTMGADAFGDLLLEILAERGIPGIEAIKKAVSPIPAIGKSLLNGQSILLQKQPGKNVVRIMIPRAKLKTDSARALTKLAEQYGEQQIVFSQRHNLELHHVPDNDVAQCLEEIHRIGFRTDGFEHLPDLVACTGKPLCKMAITHTQTAYNDLYEALATDESYWKRVGPLRMNITGCPNNCAHAWLADIGLRGKRIRTSDGEIKEAYTVFLGGKLSEAGRLAVELMDIPADDIVPGVRKIIDTYLEHRLSADEWFIDFFERLDIETLKYLILPNVD